MTFSLAVLMFACKEDEVDPGKQPKPTEPPYIDYEGPVDYWLPNKSGDTVINVVDVNGAYFATVAEGGDWCKTSEVDIHSFKVSFEEQRVSEDRRTSITLSLDGVDDIVIGIGQRGPAPILRTDSAKYTVTTDVDGIKSLGLSFPYLGMDTIVPVTTNGNYTVEVEAGNEWCTVSDKTETGFKLGAVQNSGLEVREAKITVSLTYAYYNSTVRFEFVVSQLPTPILLSAPPDETVIPKATGFPYTFSWSKTGGIPSYSLAVSTSSAFPEGETTKVITVGNVDSYSLPLNDIAGVIASNHAIKVPLYWKVIPTNPDINVATETKKFYVERKYASTILTGLRLNGGSGSWTGFEIDGEGNDVFIVNAGQSSRRTFMSTYPITESVEAALEGKAFALSYEYKTSNRNLAYGYDEFQVFHYAGPYSGDWNIDGPTTLAQYTDDWREIIFPLTSTRTWGTVGNVTTIFIRPMDGTNNIAGMKYHVRNIKIDVYE